MREKDCEDLLGPEGAHGECRTHRGIHAAGKSENGPLEARIVRFIPQKFYKHPLHRCRIEQSGNVCF